MRIAESALAREERLEIVRSKNFPVLEIANENGALDQSVGITRGKPKFRKCFGGHLDIAEQAVVGAP